MKIVLRVAGVAPGEPGSFPQFGVGGAIAVDASPRRTYRDGSSIEVDRSADELATAALAAGPSGPPK